MSKKMGLQSLKVKKWQIQQFTTIEQDFDLSDLRNRGHSGLQRIFGESLESLDHKNIDVYIGYYVKKGRFAISEGVKMALLYYRTRFLPLRPQKSRS